MDDKKELLHVLEEDMKEQSSLVIEQIHYEITSLEEKQLRIYEEGLKKEVESFKERELNDLKKLSATLSSQGKLKIQRELLQYREKLVQDLFEEVEDKMKDFTKGSQYSEFLKKKAQELSIMGGIIYVRPEDKELMQSILKELQFNATVETDEITLGGFRYVQQEQRVEVDSTLDTKVKDQRVWFENHSGLIV